MHYCQSVDCAVFVLCCDNVCCPVSQQPSIGVGSIFGVPHLDGLLTISSKAIQARIRNGALL